jgi:hypothetical protein
VQEHALPVGALFVSKPCGAVLGRTKLGPEDPVAVLGAINGQNTPRSVLLLFECNVDAEGLVLAVVALAAAYGNLQDITVLSEELVPTETLEQLFLADCGCQAGHINQVFLDHPNANKVLAVLLLGLALLRLPLTLLGSTLLLVFLYVPLELGNPVVVSSRHCAGGNCCSLLFLSDHFPLYRFVVVWPPTCWTQAVHVVADVVETKLTYLQDVVSSAVGMSSTNRRTWYPQGHGRKFRSERSNSSMQRGLTHCC